MIAEITSPKNMDMLTDAIGLTKSEHSSPIIVVKAEEAKTNEAVEHIVQFESVARKKHLSESSHTVGCKRSGDLSTSSSISLLSSATTDKPDKTSRSGGKALRNKFGLINDCALLNELTMNMYDYVDYDEDNRMYLVKNPNEEEEQDEEEEDVEEEEHQESGAVPGAWVEDDDDPVDPNATVTQKDHEDEEEEEEDDGKTNITTLHDFV